MRNLLAFLYRSRIFILFVFLEIIAFIWISNSRSFQRTAWANSANAISGNILEETSNIKEYLDLVDQNDRLARENAKLRSLNKNAYFPLIVDTLQKIDSAYSVRYSFIKGEIINSSYRKARNYMTINRGRIHGVKSGMGIIGSKGVVGIVKDVSSHFSTVIPLINPSFSVSGKIKSAGFFGPVVWNSSDFRYAHLTDIPRYASIKIGDTVITDSRSMLFPMGIDIGYVESYELQEDQNFFKIKIRLATDFASIQHIYIVKDKMKLEIETLQNQSLN